MRDRLGHSNINPYVIIFYFGWWRKTSLILFHAAAKTSQFQPVCTPIPLNFRRVGLGCIPHSHSKGNFGKVNFLSLTVYIGSVRWFLNHFPNLNLENDGWTVGMNLRDAHRIELTIYTITINIKKRMK